MLWAKAMSLQNLLTEDQRKLWDSSFQVKFKKKVKFELPTSFQSTKKTLILMENDSQYQIMRAKYTFLFSKKKFNENQKISEKLI